jgi:hypothetical protein
VVKVSRLSTEYRSPKPADGSTSKVKLKIK